MESTSTTTMISATSTAADDYSNIVDAPKTPPPVTIASDVIANPADAELCMTSMAASRIALGKRLLATLELFRAVEGVQKIERKIGQEVKFLERVVKSGQLKVNHVLCSNLVHYESLTETLLRCANIKHIDYPVAMVERQSPLRVDIVADNGSTWIKVIARNPKSLDDTARGRSGYGAKTIVDQAEEFVEAAAENVYFFQAPRVRFAFAQRIAEPLADELRAVGVDVTLIEEMCQTTVTTNATPTCRQQRLQASVAPPELNDFEAVRRVATLNLDVTTMLAYISAMTNGSAHWEFPEAVLTEQALWERQSPVKTVLDSVFEGKPLICCRTAANSFWDICNLLGGEGERRRAVQFMQRVQVLPDTEHPGELERLQFGGKIKARSVQIFSFGLAHRALTVTANEGFIRSARMQAVHIPSFVHGARPLSEQKEARARKLSDDVSADGVVDTAVVRTKTTPVTAMDE